MFRSSPEWGGGGGGGGSKSHTAHGPCGADQEHVLLEVILLHHPLYVLQRPAVRAVAVAVAADHPAIGPTLMISCAVAVAVAVEVEVLPP